MMQDESIVSRPGRRSDPTMPRLRSSLAAACWLLVACESPEAPEAGAVSVSAATRDLAPPFSGMAVTLDGVTYTGLNGSTPLLIAPVPAGQHQLGLNGLPMGCTVDGAPLKPVTVVPHDTVQVEFVVACAEVAATVLVTASSAGEEIDPNGYRVVLDGVVEGVITAAGALTVAAPPGRHTLELGHLTANCTANGNPREIAVVSGGGQITTHFDVTCGKAPPAGRRHEIAFFTDRNGSGSTHGEEIYLMNEDGTGVRPVPNTSGPLGYAEPTWSPDGSRLLVVGSAGLIVLDPKDGASVPIPNTAGAGEPAWSPDGSRIAFIGNPDDPQVWVADVDGSNAKPVTEDARSSPPSSPTWAPDGSRLAYIGEENFADGFTIGRIVIVNLENGVRDTVYTDEGTFLGEVAWSPDGTMLAFSSPSSATFRYQIYVLDLTPGSRPRSVSSGTLDDWDPSWSPDGTKIAFTRFSIDSTDIYTVNLDGTEELRITNAPSFEGEPAWRP
jgi:TolB protein